MDGCLDVPYATLFLGLRERPRGSSNLRVPLPRAQASPHPYFTLTVPLTLKLMEKLNTTELVGYKPIFWLFMDFYLVCRVLLKRRRRSVLGGQSSHKLLFRDMLAD